MNQATQHRGPDGTGEFCDGQISLGHNLLAIVEKPELSKQPIISNDHRYAMVYNGEIYNYKEIQKDLEKEGERFATQSDAEILFRGLIKNSSSFLKRLDGMYAIAFYDSKKKSIFLARDPSGMKPLYWYQKKDKLVFSSELRGILVHNIDRKLNHTAANIYFKLGYVPGPLTLISGVKKVCPGQIVKFDLDSGNISTDWVTTENQRTIEDGADLIDIKNALGQSVLAHTMGLKPFGLYLSGGLDSTIILYELNKCWPEKVKTYTTRFDINGTKHDYNEDADMAKRLCQDYSIEHHELLITEKDLISATEDSIATIEEPRYSPSVPAYWLLAKKASKDVTIILSGNGGDELFFGYPRYVYSRNFSLLYSKYPHFLLNSRFTMGALIRGRIKVGAWLDLTRPLDRWVTLNRFNARLDPDIYKLKNQFDVDDLIQYLKKQNFPAVTNPLDDTENSIAELDRLFWLADEEFLRTDKIVMHFGMEGRFPMLARGVVKVANSIPSKAKFSDGVLKASLRKAYADLLPDYIINKPKTGWRAPISEWMMTEYGKFVRQILSDQYYEPNSDLFDLKNLNKKYINNIQQFNTTSIKKFMPIFTFQIWARNFKINP